MTVSNLDLLRDKLVMKALTTNKTTTHLGDFVNVTPYMGGDYKTRTFVNNRFVGYPTAQAIKSRARYASLLALASFVTSPNDYREVYNAFTVTLDKLGEVPVLGLIYGCIRCSKKVEAFASPFKVKVRAEGGTPWRFMGRFNRYHALLSQGQ